MSGPPLGQRVPGSVQAAFYRPHGNAQGAGDFLVRHIVPVAHDDHRSFLASEHRQELLHGFLFLFAAGLIFRAGGAVGRVVLGEKAFEGKEDRPFSAEAVDAVMGRDRKHPCAERPLKIIFGKALVRTPEGFLRGILGIFRVSQHPVA